MDDHSTLDHHGYRIEVMPAGRGWTAHIYSPGSPTMLMEKPITTRPGRRERVIADAMVIVDRHRTSLG